MKYGLSPRMARKVPGIVVLKPVGAEKKKVSEDNDAVAVYVAGYDYLAGRLAEV